MCRMGSSTSRTVDRACFRVWYIIYLTTGRVGDKVNSGNGPCVEISQAFWSGSMALGIQTSGQKPRRRIEVGTLYALTKITAIALAEVALTPDNGSSGHVYLYTGA